jgi:hypothetical protein
MQKFILLILLFFAGTTNAESLVGSDQQTYSDSVRLSSATWPGDRYATVTGRLLMDGTLAGPVRLFSDVSGLPSWIGNLAAVQEVLTRSLTDRTLYMRFSAPAGFRDRDGVIRFVASKEAPGVIILTLQDIPSPSLISNAVRMKDVRGRFRVEKVAAGVLAVEFRLHYDSSATPVFLANLSVRQQVRQTLLQMQQRVELPLRGANVDEAMARALGL